MQKEVHTVPLMPLLGLGTQGDLTNVGKSVLGPKRHRERSPADRLWEQWSGILAWQSTTQPTN